MSTRDKWSDAETWDQIVDGPITPSQLAELVAVCDRQPELWKRCALAFIEEQTLRHELRELMCGQAGLDCMSERDGVLSAPLPCSVDENHARAQKSISPTSKRTTNFSALWSNLALAASLMITFAVGWQSSQRFGLNRYGSSEVTNLVGSPKPSGHLMERGPVQSRSTDPAQAVRNQDGMLAGTDPEAFGQSIDRETIDRVNAETFAKALQVNLNEELEPEYQQLRRRGYDVESQEGFVPIWLYDGSSAVIPYQQIKVRPKLTGQTY